VAISDALRLGKLPVEPLMLEAHSTSAYTNPTILKLVKTHSARCAHVPSFSKIRQPAAELLTTEQIFPAVFQGGGVNS